MTLPVINVLIKPAAIGIIFAVFLFALKIHNVFAAFIASLFFYATLLILMRYFNKEDKDMVLKLIK